MRVDERFNVCTNITKIIYLILIPPGPGIRHTVSCIMYHVSYHIFFKIFKYISYISYCTWHHRYDTLYMYVTVRRYYRTYPDLVKTPVPGTGYCTDTRVPLLPFALSASVLSSTRNNHERALLELSFPSSEEKATT